MVTVSEILIFLKMKGYEFEYIGNEKLEIQGFSSLASYKKDTITWVKKRENWKDNNEAILVAVVENNIDIPVKNMIRCKNSKAVFFSIIEEFFCPKEDTIEKIGKNSVIGDKVCLKDGVRIGNNCSITGDIIIGENTVISDNVVIKNRVVIGANCQIHSLTTIGEDGFGYHEDDENNKTMIKHYGGVEIGDNVFIGAHVNIARGTIDDTIIEDGVKIAPHTHIGHNNHICKNATIICSQSYGSVTIEKNAYIVGSIVKNQSRVGSNSLIGMGSVVTKDIPSNKVAFGIPAKVVKDNS